MEVINGQVAVTIVTAQIAAPKNGLRIQSDVPIRAPMKSNARKVRVMSRWASIMGSSFLRSEWVRRQGKDHVQCALCQRFVHGQPGAGKYSKHRFVLRKHICFKL